MMETAWSGLASLEENLQGVVLSGLPYKGSELPEVKVVENIGYATRSSRADPRVIVELLEKNAAEAFGSAPDVWHLHNHSLGKNPALSEAVGILAEKGHGMLLHIHDFAEDGRPSNYLDLRSAMSQFERLYPIGPKIRYAALNKRDASFLVEAGLPTEQLTLLPNPVPAVPVESSTSRPKDAMPPNLVLYPVRAVRRKNLGELALLSAAFPEFTFANTLGPTNPAYASGYKQWKDFVNRLQLPVHYGLAAESSHSFSSLVAHASMLVTTSVAEGFGLAFLEPWLIGKTLTGRDIPEITMDFREAGLDLEHLYQRLELPIELIDEKLLQSKIRKTLDNLFAAYQTPLPENAMPRAIEAITSSGLVDFGRLDEPFQENLVRAVVSSPAMARAIRQQANLVPRPAETLERNSKLVSKAYSVSDYGQKLRSVYREIVEAQQSDVGHLDSKALLSAFLRPERLFLLRN